jgi:hypothetical protein
MRIPFVSAALIWTAIFVMTTAALADDRASAQPPRDAEAEQILKRARDALAKIDRLEVDCQWSDLDSQHETEVCYQAHFYLQNPAGYVFQIRPLPVVGKVSRGRTKAGRPFHLKSRLAETTLFVDGVSTEIDDAHRTYLVEKCEPQSGNPIADVEQPGNFSGIVIPYPLHRMSDWNALRTNYRIEQFATTATTVGIALTAKSHQTWDEKVKKGLTVVGDAPPDAMLRPPAFWKEAMGDYAVAPSRDEIILDRRTLLPKSWRRIYGWSDSLITYERFNVNPAPRTLKVSLSGYREGSPPISQYNFTVVNADPAAKAAGPTTFLIVGADELDAQLLLLETGYRLVRLVGLF